MVAKCNSLGVGNVVFQYGKTNPLDWRVRRSILISDYVANTKKIYFVEVDKTQEERDTPSGGSKKYFCLKNNFQNLLLKMLKLF